MIPIKVAGFRALEPKETTKVGQWFIKQSNPEVREKVFQGYGSGRAAAEWAGTTWWIYEKTDEPYRLPGNALFSKELTLP